MQIVVQLPTSRKGNMTLDCNSSTTIGEIKSKIYKKWEVHPKDQRLIFGGKILLDDMLVQNLHRLNVSNNIIYLSMRLPFFSA